MKIINREEFLKLKGEVLYSRFEPDIFNGLEIKIGGGENDWNYQDLVGNIECDDSYDFASKCDEKEFCLDFECGQRDGSFENEQLFAIYSKEEVKMLINRLKEITN